MRVSTELTADEAIGQIQEITDPGRLKDFVPQAEKRTTVLTAAAKKMEGLGLASLDEQGEQKGPITEAVVQNAKGAVTIDNIVKQVDEAARKKAADSLAEAAEREKADKPSRPAGVVTCEDVVQKMRKQGMKI
ncbi:MAG: hypothetical protein M0Z60_12160 [Nitrospiraceae bacterium]|nr:hypothetical protein [Nitrospiraceae bacterium]